MKISHHLAQDIVEEMKDIIGQEVNYFDSNAYIIASTDKTRIGNFHGGAKKVLESEEELIIEYDNQYEGTRRGINLPVYFNNRVVGVVGITGDKEEVGQYGRIIERITNILIKDEYIRAEKKRESESKKQFIEELLFSNNVKDSNLETWGNMMNLNFKLKRQVLIVSLSSRATKGGEILNQDIGRLIFKNIEGKINNNKENLLIQSGSNIIVIYQPIRIGGSYRLGEEIISLSKTISKNIEVYIGIGSEVEGIDLVKDSYKKAKKALEIGYSIGRERISEYNKLDIGLLIEGIDKSLGEEYYTKILNNLAKKDIDDYYKLLSAYIRNNGSINKAADELYIHKNTLQYRLNKLGDLTGYNPREIKGTMVLYLAFLLKKYNEKS